MVGAGKWPTPLSCANRVSYSKVVQEHAQSRFWVSPKIDILQTCCETCSSAWPPLQQKKFKFKQNFLIFILHPLPVLTSLDTLTQVWFHLHYSHWSSNLDKIPTKPLPQAQFSASIHMSNAPILWTSWLRFAGISPLCLHLSGTGEAQHCCQHSRYVSLVLNRGEGSSP